MSPFFYLQHRQIPHRVSLEELAEKRRPSFSTTLTSPLSRRWSPDGHDVPAGRDEQAGAVALEIVNAAGAVDFTTFASVVSKTSDGEVEATGGAAELDCENVAEIARRTATSKMTRGDRPPIFTSVP